MGYEFRPAVREQTKLLIALAGASGSGKTYSALQLATGLAGPGGKIGFIDTEARRALHYASTFRFEHCDMTSPFRPDRFREAIMAGETAGFDVIVIDSFSHEYAGEGGIVDWAAEMEAAGVKSPGNWAAPKQSHKKLISRLLQARSHLIFCLRAEDKVKIEKVDQGGRMKTVVVPVGWQPVCEKSFMYEMTASFVLSPDAPGVGRPEKLQDQHRHAFPDGAQIGADAGRLLAEWANGGAAPSAPRVDPWIAASEAAEGGKASFTAWWNGPGKPLRHLVKDRLAELQAIAARAEEAPPAEEEDPFTPAGDAGQAQVSPETAGQAAGAQDGQQGATPSGDDWSLLDASGWVDQVYKVGDIIDACTTVKALSVIQAAPKFAEPYAAMKRHAPKSAEAVDEMVAKRREALSNG